MKFPLTIDHLLWRMQHVHRGSQVISVALGGVAHDQKTFPETATRARALAGGLRVIHDLDQGSVVAVLAFNSRSHLELMLGLPTVGAVVESINVRTGARVIMDQLRASRPAVVLVDQEALDHGVVGPTVYEVLEECREAGWPTQVLDSRTDAGVEAILEVGLSSTTSNLQPADEDAPAYLYHTSGTTGAPKTYTVTHRDAVLHALCQATTVGAALRADDRVLPLAPFFHVNGWGIPLTCAVTGSDLVLMGSDASADSVVNVLVEKHVTVAAAVPTVWYDVCEAVRQRFPRLSSSDPTPRFALREVLTGGSAVPASVAAGIERHLGASVVAAWGMTESMACSTYERTDPTLAAGRPIPLVETRIAEPIGAQGEDQRGRLEVRGAFIVGGRTGNSTVDGWMDTGDIASIDDNGRLLLHDRQKDLIKSGGEWIVSAELEQRLCSHPGVSNAAVVGRPDPRWMERPVAYVVLNPSRAQLVVSADELREHLAAEFPKWWLPDHFIIVDELPRTAVGKIDKVSLRRTPRELGECALGADVSGSETTQPETNEVAT